jgi:hypothetical protein
MDVRLAVALLLAFLVSVFAQTGLFWVLEEKEMSKGDETERSNKDVCTGVIGIWRALQAFETRSNQ